MSKTFRRKLDLKNGRVDMSHGAGGRAMAELISSAQACKQLVRTALSRFRLPYLTITPTFSICPVHGYLAGEHEFCPKCDEALLQKQQCCGACGG